MTVAGFSLATARQLQPSRMWVGKLTLWLVEESLAAPDCWERWLAEAKRLGTETLPALSERFGLSESYLQAIHDRPPHQARVQRLYVQLPSHNGLVPIDSPIQLPSESLVPHPAPPPFPASASGPTEGRSLLLANPYQLQATLLQVNESLYVYLPGQETPIIFGGDFTFPETTPSDWQQAWHNWCQANGLAEHSESPLDKQGIDLRLPEEVKAKVSGEVLLEVGEGDLKEVAVAN